MVWGLGGVRFQGQRPLSLPPCSLIWGDLPEESGHSHRGPPAPPPTGIPPSRGHSFAWVTFLSAAPQDRSRCCWAIGWALLKRKNTNYKHTARIPAWEGPVQGSTRTSGFFSIRKSPPRADLLWRKQCKHCRTSQGPPPDRWSPSQAPGALGCPQRVQTRSSCLTLPPHPW